jgi:integrase
MHMQGTSGSSRTLVESRGRGQGSIYVRPSGSFEVQYTSSSGKRQFVVLRDAHGNPITNITAARKAATAVVGKRDMGKDIAPNKLTFDSLAELFLESFESLVVSGERKRRSLDDYRWRYERYLREPLGRIQAQQIRREHILGVLNDLRRKGLSTSTLHVVHRTFAVIVEEGRDRNILDIDTRLGKKRIKVSNSRAIRKLDQTELAAVIKAASPRWRALFLTAATIGAGASELLGLTFSDLHLIEGEASISISKQLGRDGSLIPPKTANGHRTVRIGEGLRLALLAEYNRAEDKTGFVFGQDTEAVGRYGLARRAFTRAVTNAGVEYDRATQKVSLHSFRHAAARRMLRDGLDVQRVALTLGDTVQTVVSTYLRSEEHDKATETDPAVLDVEVAA